MMLSEPNDGNVRFLGIKRKWLLLIAAPIFLSLAVFCFLLLLISGAYPPVSALPPVSAQPPPVRTIASAPGFCLSFDDGPAARWEVLNTVLDRHNAKATFFPSNLESLTEKDWYVLQDLQQDGHEIGCHGFKHFNAKSYIDRRTKELVDATMESSPEPLAAPIMAIEDYVNTEVTPALEVFEQKNLLIQSFAFPEGAYNGPAARTLYHPSGQFRCLRGITYPPKNQHIRDLRRPYLKCKADFDRRVVHAINIDPAYATDMEIRAALQRCAERGEILMLYSHGVATAGSGLTRAKLDALLTAADELGLRSYRCMDLFAGS